MATGRVAQALHFKKANLIQATSKYINDVTVMGGTLGQIIIELGACEPGSEVVDWTGPYLKCLLVVLDVVPVNVVVRADWLSQLWANNQAWSLSGRTASEEHNPTASVLE